VRGGRVGREELAAKAASPLKRARVGYQTGLGFLRGLMRVVANVGAGGRAGGV
jgi:hypothetical protein